MQCPLAGCLMNPKYISFAMDLVGLVMGVLSLTRPRQSIGLYQRTMERLNWKVMPINEVSEIRNTRIRGFILIVVTLGVFYAVFSCS